VTVAGRGCTSVLRPLGTEATLTQYPSTSVRSFELSNELPPLTGVVNRNRTGPHPDSLQPRDVRMINGVLRLLSNHLAVLDYGQRDTLTGLLNRRTFDQSFDKIVERNRPGARCRHRTRPAGSRSRISTGSSRSNDRYGHLFGDDVLLLVARLMRQAFRAPITCSASAARSSWSFWRAHRRTTPRRR